MPQRVSKDNFQSEVLSADTLVLADFIPTAVSLAKDFHPYSLSLKKSMRAS